MKTFALKKEEVQRQWFIIDASDKVLGRLATKVADRIRGKDKPTFTPHTDTGDNVIIINAAKVKLTGQKWDDKIYYHHTGWMGGIKSVTAKQILDKKPSDLLQKAIHGMLPKNRLGRTLNNNYRIYDTAEHPHGSQNPESVNI